MGGGRLPGWTGLIQPFRDRPDVQLPVVWYAVPTGTQPGPVSPFVTRFDEDRERWAALGVGTAYRSLQPYFGPRPPFTGVQPLVGTPDQWANGLLYSDYLHGQPPPPPCFVVGGQLAGVRVRQGQGIALDGVGGPSLLRTYGCPNCPGYAYRTGVLKASGIADGSVSASALNGAFGLTNLGSCQWAGANFAVSGLPGVYRWQVVIRPTDTRVSVHRVDLGNDVALNDPGGSGLGCRGVLTLAPAAWSSGGAWDFRNSTITYTVGA